MNRRIALRMWNSRLQLVFAAIFFAGAGSANTLCTTFNSPALTGHTFQQAGFVCNVGDLQLFDLTYVWTFPVGVPSPGAITIMVDSSNLSQPKLIVTAANNWFVPGGSDSAADFSLFYT